MYYTKLLSLNWETGESLSVGYAKDNITTVYSWVKYFNHARKLHGDPVRLYYIS